ncbi:alpha/beta hydrolase [Actinophytocola sp.]|uniref:alpha/beta fold hydrolase n=1 Tax=Actinophytocola sp. TaxID=1872138 RepID=UPI002ED3F0C1
MPIFVTEDGAALHYDLSGEGKPLITLAGGAGRHPSYLGDLAGLPGQLVIPHLRGVGETPGPSKSYWEQASDLEDLRGHLVLQRLDLVAHSAGTRLAMAYAAQFPDNVASMLLITPPSAHLTDTPSDAAEITAHRRGEPAFEKAMAAYHRRPKTQSDFEAWQADTAAATYALWTEREQAHARVGKTDLATVNAYFGVPAPPDFAQLLSKTDATVRVIAGAQDFTTGLAPVLAAAKLFTNGEVVVIDDCGHYPWVEQPGAFRRAADPFVA